MPAPKFRDPLGPADLVAVARERFQRGDAVDIPGIADELGVSRATAYRWLGNNERLMGEVIASLTEATFRRARAETRGRGATRVLAVMERGMRYVLGSEAYRNWLRADPQKALRVVASKEGPSQRRAIELHRELLEEEAAKGHLKLQVDSHTMAYALVRLAESFLYADIVAGEAPDVEKALKVLKLLLT